MDHDCWGTPPELFYWLDEVLGFHFEADVAATRENKLCKRFFRDGLATEWHKRAKCVIGNVPYSNIDSWLRKAYLESLQGCTSVIIIPSHKGERWWHDWIADKAESVILIQGRVRFLHPETRKPGKTAPFGSSIVVYSAHKIPGSPTQLLSVQHKDIYESSEK